MEDRRDQGDKPNQQQDSWNQQQQQGGDRQQQQGGQRQQEQSDDRSGQQGDMGQSGTGQPGQQDSWKQQQQFDQQGSGQHGGSTGMDTRFRDQIREHMEVIDADGQHVGTVDALENDRIKLTKSDSGAGGSSDMGGSAGHRYIQLDQVQGIEGGRIRLSQRGGAGGYGTEADR